MSKHPVITSVSARLCIALMVASCVALLALPAIAAAAPAAAANHPAQAATAKPKVDDAYEREPLSSDFEKAIASTDATGHKVDAKSQGKSGGAGAIGRMFFGLIIVLAVIFGVYWLLKRYGESRMNGMAGAAGIIDVVATTSLAPNRSLHLVRVGGEMVLVGATENSITQLSTIDQHDLMNGGVAGGEFHSLLNAQLGSVGGARANLQQQAAGGPRKPFLTRVLGNLQMMTAR